MTDYKCATIEVRFENEKGFNRSIYIPQKMDVARSIAEVAKFVDKYTRDEIIDMFKDVENKRTFNPYREPQSKYCTAEDMAHIRSIREGIIEESDRHLDDKEPIFHCFALINATLEDYENGLKLASQDVVKFFTDDARYTDCIVIDLHRNKVFQTPNTSTVKASDAIELNIKIK